MQHPTDRIAHTMACYTRPVKQLWLERETAQWVHHEESIRRPIAPWASALTTELHFSPSSPINSHIQLRFKSDYKHQCNSICGCFKKKILILMTLHLTELQIFYFFFFLFLNSHIVSQTSLGFFNGRFVCFKTWVNPVDLWSLLHHGRLSIHFLG